MQIESCYMYGICMTRAGKKGKETPTANESAPAVSMPSKPPTQMKKRGEEDLASKYLSKILYANLWSDQSLIIPDDEPESGPSCYFILTGFNTTELFKHLAPIKMKANALIKLVSCKEAPSDSRINKGRITHTWH